MKTSLCEEGREFVISEAYPKGKTSLKKIHGHLKKGNYEDIRKKEIIDVEMLKNKSNTTREQLSIL